MTHWVTRRRGDAGSARVYMLHRCHLTSCLAYHGADFQGKMGQETLLACDSDGLRGNCSALLCFCRAKVAFEDTECMGVAMSQQSRIHGHRNLHLA